MTANYVQIRHDAFGRYTLLRREGRLGECDYCGQKGRTFQYAYQEDDDWTGPEWDKHYFCHIGCFRSFHGFLKQRRSKNELLAY